MKKEIYEKSYKDKKHFSFGENWQEFLKTLDDERKKEAKKSLADFLGGRNAIKGKTFVDFGSGSGLFSLAAYLLGAKKVFSVDIDDFSVACAKYLRKKEGTPKNWEIKKGSALDRKFIKSLGKFDIVYSWGVLHHTGDMYSALENVSKLMTEKGIFFLAIYNRNQGRSALLSGSSELWLKIKRFYNNTPKIGKKVVEGLYYAYFVLGYLLLLKNPFAYMKDYGKNRGMSFHHDAVDWLGGYPYEFAAPEEIINYFGKLNISCKKLTYRNGIGCNEYLLVNLQSGQKI